MLDLDAMEKVAKAFSEALDGNLSVSDFSKRQSAYVTEFLPIVLIALIAELRKARADKGRLVETLDTQTDTIESLRRRLEDLEHLYEVSGQLNKVAASNNELQRKRAGKRLRLLLRVMDQDVLAGDLYREIYEEIQGARDANSEKG